MNNSKETIYLGNASGKKQNGKEVTMDGLIELTPGAKLEPMLIKEKGKEVLYGGLNSQQLLEIKMVMKKKMKMETQKQMYDIYMHMMWIIFNFKKVKL